MNFLCGVLTCLFTIHATSGIKTYLYGAPPGGGLFGGRVNTVAMSAKIRSAFSKFSTPVNVAAYDPTSHHVILDVDRISGRTLEYGPICESKFPNPPRYLASLTTETISHPEFGDCFECTIYGVSMLDSVIYFVFSGVWSKDLYMTRFVEIRSFTSCDACVMRGRDGVLVDGMMPFWALYNCSTHVHDVHRTSFDAVDMDNTRLIPTSTLKIINQHQTSFFLQILNSTGTDQESSMTLDLYHVTSSTVKILHREVLSAKYQIDVSRSMGGVDFRENVLCWTVMDRIFCADYQLEESALRNLARVMAVADSAIYGVCTGE